MEGGVDFDWQNVISNKVLSSGGSVVEWLLDLLCS